MVDVERIAYPIVFTEPAGFKDTYGGPEGLVLLESNLLRPRGVQSDTVLVFMHPVGGGSYLPMVTSLARAGQHVIYCNSRYRGNDSALIMEKVVLDLGAAVRDARERLGYEKVVLAGWSGGGSLSLFYQAEAEQPTVSCTPSGDAPDLTEAGLLPADGMLLLAAHPSRHRVLTDSLDPSIVDELDPSIRDRTLDLYDPANPNQPPYDLDFVARFRAAQLDRNRRITAWARDTLESFTSEERRTREHSFVVHGTMADPRWLDPTINPNEREAGRCFLGDPQTVNMSPVGLARFSTLRSWLSQWSFDDANADGIRSAARISIPALLVWNGADDICIPGHAFEMFDAVPHGDKEIHGIPGATHYYIGSDQKEPLGRAVDLCTGWLERHGFGSV